MKTIILHNIISSNTIYKLNSYIKKHKKDLGEVLVLFSSQSESNRRWKTQEKPCFKYRILPNFAIKFKGKDLFTYFINPTIIKELKEINPDRIIICGWDIYPYQAAFFWGGVNKKHLTLWSGSTTNEPSWRRKISLPLVKLFVQLSQDFIAYGTRAREYLIKLGADKEKIEIFVNDVNKEYFQDQAKKFKNKREKLRKKFSVSTPKNLIFVGQLIERKGILDLIKSFEIFKEDHPDWGLIIVGYGPLEKRIKKTIFDKKLKDIHMLGFMEQYDLPEIYSIADVLVLPSHEEVWGLVVNEALYSGLKVIVSNRCGCAPDLVEKNNKGFIFDTNKVGDLNQKMSLAAGFEEKLVESTPPFFSIITCTKNSKRFIDKNLNSVKNQTFTNYEHIFIDGFSKDNTIKMINSYKSKTGKSVIIQQKKPLGISDAMNQGIKIAKGKYLIHLHADDFLQNNQILENIHDFLIEKDYPDWIYGQIQTVEKDRSPVGIFPKNKIFQKSFYWLLPFINFVPHQAVFIKTEIFDKYGYFDQKLSSKMDLDFWLRIGKKTNWIFFPEVISCYTLHSGAQSSGKNFLTENTRNLHTVLRHSFSFPVYQFAILSNKIQSRFNKTLR